MEGQINNSLRVVRAEQVKGMSEIERFLVAVPFLVCIGG